jgi:hypothetical protein
VRHPLDPRDDIVILAKPHQAAKASWVLGNGRVYEIELTVEDAQHNTSSIHSCFVGVNALGHHGSPTSDGRVFTVRP